MTNVQPKTNPENQRGAVSLEFALLFTIFFGVFYAIVSFSAAILVKQGLTQAAAEGARESARLDPASFQFPADYDTALKNAVQSRVETALSWLPKSAYDKIKANGVSVSGPTYPSSDADADKKKGSITVTVSYLNYRTDPLIPSLNLPGLGQVPDLPQNLVGQALFRPN
jgi:Flp pilus assembly protein TadG